VNDQQMTVEEIRAQFDAEWILVEDPLTNEALDVLGGKVVCHSKDRDEVYRQAIARKSKRNAILYTGQIPAEGTELLL
jgi:hypothetical protein